jgi:N-acyl homoserine lactone hydrolase
MRKISPLIGAGLAAFLFAACTPKAPAPGSETKAEAEAAPEVAAAAPLTVNVLDCGTIQIADLDGFSSSGDYKGIADEFADACFLINHPNGKLLWDLGVPGILKQAGPLKQGDFTVSLNATLTEQLSALGVAPADLTYFSISHSHFDHIGQVDQVLGATWLVHQKELDAMLPPDGSPAKLPADQLALMNAFKAVAKKEVFTGEKDVFGDGTVVIFETPGHTPGHTALQLNMPETGAVLLTGDLYHRAESRNLSRVPRFNADETLTRASMAAFEERARTLGAKVIIQHEPADITPLGGMIR